MAKIGGTQVNLGIGLESAAGTPVAASFYPKWTDLSFQAVSEKSMLKSQRGLRTAQSDSRIRRKYAKGSFSIVPNSTHAAPLLYLALGTLSSGSITDSAYLHTISVNNTNAGMKTATVLLEQGGEVTQRYANCVVNALNIDVSDDYAKMTVDMIGAFPDTSTLSESYTQPTEYSFADYSVKFGTSLANAGGNSATPLKSFSLNISNNVLLDEAFMSGAVTPTAGGFVAGRLAVTGSYSLQFDTTAQLDLYTAGTKKAAIVSFVGALIGVSSTQDMTINLGKLVLTSPPEIFNLDGLVIVKQDFAVENDPTDLTIGATVRNATVSY